MTSTKLNDEISAVGDEVDFTTTTTTITTHGGEVQLKYINDVKLEVDSSHHDHFPNFQEDIRNVVPQVNQENIDSGKIDIPEESVTQEVMPNGSQETASVKVETLESLGDVPDLTLKTEEINNESIEALSVKLKDQLNPQDENSHDESQTSQENSHAVRDPFTKNFQGLDSGIDFSKLDQDEIESGIPTDPFKESSLEDVSNMLHTELDLESDPFIKSNPDFYKDEVDSGNENDPFEGSTTLEDPPKLNRDDSGIKTDQFEGSGHFNEAGFDHADMDSGLKTDPFQESNKNDFPNWNREEEGMDSGIQHDPFQGSQLEDFTTIDPANMDPFVESHIENYPKGSKEDKTDPFAGSKLEDFTKMDPADMNLKVKSEPFPEWNQGGTDSGITSDPFSKDNLEDLPKWNQNDSGVKDDPFSGSDPFNEVKSNDISNDDPWKTDDQVNKLRSFSIYNRSFKLFFNFSMIIIEK